MLCFGPLSLSAALFAPSRLSLKSPRPDTPSQTVCWAPKQRRPFRGSSSRRANRLALGRLRSSQEAAFTDYTLALARRLNCGPPGDILGILLGLRLSIERLPLAICLAWACQRLSAHRKRRHLTRKARTTSFTSDTHTHKRHLLAFWPPGHSAKTVFALVFGQENGQTQGRTVFGWLLVCLPRVAREGRLLAGELFPDGKI